MRLAWLAAVALFALAAAPARGDEWSHQYPVKGRPQLHVKTDDGQVRIESGTASQIDARVTTEGWRIGPGQVTITESQTGDRVFIEVRLPNRVFSFGRRSVSVVVRVPKESDLDIRTGDGGIEAQPVSGPATGRSGRRVSPAGSRRTRGDGSMTVRGRFDVLDLRTGDGSIEAAAELGSKVATAWSLHSGDGSITVRLPDGLGAEIDAHTGDGGISLDKAVAVTGTVKENTLRGTLGPGGAPLKIQTGDGSIRLTGL